MAKRKKITEAEYYQMDDESMGWCPNCKDFTRSMTEPDAEDYDCPDCGGLEVVGTQNAMIMGFFEIEGE